MWESRGRVPTFITAFEDEVRNGEDPSFTRSVRQWRCVNSNLAAYIVMRKPPSIMWRTLESGRDGTARSHAKRARDRRSPAHRPIRTPKPGLFGAAWTRSAIAVAPSKTTAPCLVTSARKDAGDEDCQEESPVGRGAGGGHAEFDPNCGLWSIPGCAVQLRTGGPELLLGANPLLEIGGKGDPALEFVAMGPTHPCGSGTSCGRGEEGMGHLRR